MKPTTRSRWSLLVAIGLITLIAGIGLGLLRLKPIAIAESAEWVFELNYPDAKGETVALSSARGRITVVNFWATWCPPCIEEMPELSRFHEEFSSKNIKVIGLAVDSPSNVREFLSKRNFSYPLLITGGSGSELAKKLRNAVDALPYTVMIDEKGGMIRQKVGKLTEKDLKSWISEVR
ncbi:MAG: TlpA family protein disulfide reductase [Burkholderiaceae bacterium]|nr:TlpA family protein disulfide reductase [Burkholderiaceae bacterium]